jgi:hypothetical protein
MVDSFRAVMPKKQGNGGVERNYKARVKPFRKNSLTVQFG